MVKPLEGIRILDLTIAQQGPQATMMLAEMGADVIKVEAPKTGDMARVLVRARFPTPDGNFKLLSPGFFVFNRGKKSIAVDLKSKEGKEIIYRLAQQSDVLVHNFRPGVMDRLSLSYQDIKRHNLRIIYASASGWGRRGPRAQEPAFDLAAQAQGGLMSVTGEEDGPPLPAGAPVADHVGALQLLIAILTALTARERQGIGQEVHVSLLGSMLSLQIWQLSHHLMTGRPIGKAGRGHAMVPNIWYTFSTSDGHIVICGVEDRRWPDFIRALGRPELGNDHRFTDTRLRRDNKAALYSALDRIFPAKSTEQWMELLREADIPCAPVAGYEDLANDEQARENEYIVDFVDSACGPLSMVGHPIYYSETPAEVSTSHPELGEHTEEVLTWLGYTKEEIQGMNSQGVIG